MPFCFVCRMWIFPMFQKSIRLSILSTFTICTIYFPMSLVTTRMFVDLPTLKGTIRILVLFQLSPSVNLNQLRSGLSLNVYLISSKRYKKSRLSIQFQGFSLGLVMFKNCRSSVARVCKHFPKSIRRNR